VRSLRAGTGDFDLFRVGIWSGMPNLDPEQNSIRTCLIGQNWIFDPLLWRDKDTNALVPYLAEEYGYAGDNTWRFKLREGVTFHSGRPLTAKSVQFSLLRRQDEALASPNRKAFLDVVEARVVDDYTVDFVCRNPLPVLPAYLTTFSIMDEAYYAEHPKEFLALNPMGSGPFRLEEFKPDDILRVTRNDDYWGEMPAMRRIEAPVVLEDATRVAALLSGDLHISPRPTIEDFERIDASGIAKVSNRIGNRIVLGGMNYAMPPFDNKLVRQAMNFAVNQAEINEVYLKGMAEPMASGLPSTVPGFNPDIELYPYDPEMARTLLRDAGYPNGFETRIEVVPEWMISGMEIVQTLIHYLAQVDVKAEIQVFDAGTMGSRINARQAGPIFMLSWGGNSTFDADSYIQPLFGQGAFSCNDMPQIDKLVEQGRATADQAERVALYQEACEIIHDEAPVMFLHLQPNTYGVSLDHDWQARPGEMIPLWYVNQV
jgi:peptide/nickel transport system substrate-binding protein